MNSRINKKFVIIFISLLGISSCSIDRGVDPPVTTDHSANNFIIGNIETDEENICLLIENSSLKEHDLVQIIDTDMPQSVFTAKVINKGKCPGKRFGNLSKDGITEYMLELSGIERPGGFGIAVVQESPLAKVKDGHAILDINNDGTDEYFRDCSSNEGLHMTVWTGRPLAGKRIWHSYYSFNYDTEPNCDIKDYEGTD